MQTGWSQHLFLQRLHICLVTFDCEVYSHIDRSCPHTTHGNTHGIQVMHTYLHSSVNRPSLGEVENFAEGTLPVRGGARVQIMLHRKSWSGSLSALPTPSRSHSLTTVSVQGLLSHKFLCSAPCFSLVVFSFIWVLCNFSSYLALAFGGPTLDRTSLEWNSMSPADNGWGTSLLSPQELRWPKRMKSQAKRQHPWGKHWM